MNNAAATSPIRPPRFPRRVVFARWGVAAFLASIFAINALSTWGLWGDAIIDCGRELDVPLQLMDGKYLYRDVRYWYGPLAPTINAWLYQLIRPHTQTLVVVGMAAAALTTWITYRAGRLFVGRLTAAACAAAFICACAFAHLTRLNAFNFVLPYACPATYGSLLALTSVYFLLQHTLRDKDRDFAAASITLGLVFLTKVELAFAGAVAYGAFLLLRLAAGRPWRAVHLVGCATVLLIPAATYGRYYALCGESLWQDNLFLPGNLSANIFSLRHSGLDRPIDSAIDVAISAGSLLAVFVVVALVQGAAVARRPQPAAPGCGVTLCIVLAAAPAVAAAALLQTGLAFSGTPVLLLAGAGLSLTHWLRRGRAERGPAAELVLLCFAGAAIARMLLQCQAGHYGFYLLPPSLVALTVIAARIVPRAVPGRDGLTTAARAAQRLIAGAATALWLATVCVTHFVQSRAIDAAVFGESPRWAVGPRGRLPVQELQAGAVDSAAAYLSEHARSARVVVFPEGSALTFVAGATNVLGVHTFLPLDFSGAYAENVMIQRLAVANPDWVVVTARNVTEYGAEGFGVDYAVELAAWLMSKYEVAAEFATQTYAVHILRRK